MTQRTFCTLFDSRYLVRALCLYESLERHHPDFRLCAYTFDKEATAVLEKLDLPRLEVVPRSAFVNEALRKVRLQRSPIEFMWTCTASIILHCAEAHPAATEITYLDADLMFFADPEIIFAEAPDAAVILSPHYPSAESWLPTIPRAGRFCVQFCTFRTDDRGMRPLRHWAAQCIDWCYDRVEDGKYGDQKYLDAYPDAFEGVHAIQNRSLALGPWSTPHDLTSDPQGRLTLNGSPVVFYHYHHFTALSFTRYMLTKGFPVYPDARDLVYKPYIRAYQRNYMKVAAIVPDFPFHAGSAKGLVFGAAGGMLFGALGRMPQLEQPYEAD